MKKKFSLNRTFLLGNLIICLSVMIGFSSNGQSQIPAFPGAEGAGAYAIGGRNGTVYKVTNLNASGPGSLVDALSQPNRIIVFSVSGIIDFQENSLEVEKDNITIAGQTAPGEGICIKNSAVHFGGKNVIIRYLRSRPGYLEINGVPKHRDALSIDRDDAEMVIVDHISTSWGSDENLTVRNDVKDITIQNCLISEGLNYFDPNNSPNRHGFGSIIASSIGGEISFHHNLYAHHQKRSPRFAGSQTLRDYIDFRNNVIYNCADETGKTSKDLSSNANYINNYLKYGLDTPSAIMYQFFELQDPNVKMYADGNYAYDSPAHTTNNWLGIIFSNGASLAACKSDTVFPLAPVNTQSAEQAYLLVLAESGASLPSRDPVDLRIANNVRDMTGHMIEYETDLPEDQRWPEYYSLPEPLDTDGDGMPDFWETQFGLDKTYPDDNMLDSDGDIYVNIEEYINNTDPTGGTIPIVWISASDSRAHESGQEQGVFTICRNGDLTGSLIVSYTVMGSATAPDDYLPLSGSVIIPQGERTAEIQVFPVNDGIPETDEMVVIVLDTTETTYNVGCPSSSLVIIKDSSLTNITRVIVPKDFTLLDNYPNPFNNETQIRINLTVKENLRVEIYDNNGRLVRTLYTGKLSAGEHFFVWNGEDNYNAPISSGIYYCVLRSNTIQKIRKLVLVK